MARSNFVIRSSWPLIGCYLSEHVCDNPQLPEGPVGDLLPDPANMIKCFEDERLIITFTYPLFLGKLFFFRYYLQNFCLPVLAAHNELSRLPSLGHLRRGEYFVQNIGVLRRKLKKFDQILHRLNNIRTAFWSLVHYC